LLSQAGSGSLATTMTPWMDLVIAFRTVFKAVELTSPAPFKPVPLIAATIAFFNVSIFPEFPEYFVFMFVFFRFDVWFCGCFSLRDLAFRGKSADQAATILTQFSVPKEFIISFLVGGCVLGPSRLPANGSGGDGHVRKAG